MEEPRRPFLDSQVANQWWINYEETRIETTDVGITFAGCETEAARTKIWTPDSVLSQAISVIVVLDESTHVSRRSGCDPRVRVGHQRPLQSWLQSHPEALPSLCNFSPRASCSGDDDEPKANKDRTQRRVMRSHRLGAGANNKGHRRKERLRLKCPRFVQNTISTTHPRMKTTCCDCWVCLKILKPGPVSTRQRNLSHHVILGSIVGECYGTNHDR